MTLRARTFTAVRWTAAGTGFQAFLQFAQVAILARLLSPGDFGLMAIASVVVSFARVFSDFGLSSGFLQRRTVTNEERSSLFWFNVLLSAVIAATVAAASPVFAWFFTDPRVMPLIGLSSLTLILAALGAQIRAAAEKVLLFQRVVLVEAVAALIGFVGAVLSALSGMGVYSLIVGALVGAATTTLLLWLYVADGWRPLWRMRYREVRSFLRFGGNMVGSSLVNHFNTTVDLILGGRLLSTDELGIYSVPRNLTLRIQFMINRVVTRVTFPLIAAVQEDVARVRAIYLHTLRMTASINAPLYLGIAFFAPDIVRILLGDGWESSGPILRILALWGVMRATFNPLGSLLVGMGRPDVALKWNLALLILVGPMLWIGSHFGAEGIALALLSLLIVLFVPAWLFLVRPMCSPSFTQYSGAVLTPMLIAFFAILPGYVAAQGFHGSLVRIAVGGVVAAPLYLVLSYLGNRQWLASMLELLASRRDQVAGPANHS